MSERMQIRLIVASFPDEESAQFAYQNLLAAKKSGEVRFVDVAALRRKQDGKLLIKEVGDPTGRQGARLGGIIGAAIGLLAGPAGVVLGGATGAWLGGFAAAATEGGLPDASLIEIGALLTEGTSALVIVAEAANYDDLVARVEGQGGVILAADDDNNEPSTPESA